MIRKSEAYLIIEKHYKKTATKFDYKKLGVIENNCKDHIWATSPSDKFRWCINCCVKQRRGSWEPDKWVGSGWCGSVVPGPEEGHRLGWQVDEKLFEAWENSFYEKTNEIQYGHYLYFIKRCYNGKPWIIRKILDFQIYIYNRYFKKK